MTVVVETEMETERAAVGMSPVTVVVTPVDATPLCSESARTSPGVVPGHVVTASRSHVPYPTIG